VTRPPQPRSSLVDTILAPLDRLIDEYTAADALIAKLIDQLTEVSAAAATRTLRAKPQRSGSEATPQSTVQRPPEYADEPGSYSAVLDLQEQLSLLEGVASVRVSMPVDGVPMLVVELTGTSEKPIERRPGVRISTRPG
jgi:hypothetical protein